MSGVDDLHEFARDHRTCGQLTRNESEPRDGRVQVTLACACGATRSRWVARDEIREAVAPPWSRRGAPPSGARPRPGLGVDRDTLEEVMRRALEEVEQSGQAPNPGTRGRIEDVVQRALRELEAAPDASRQNRAPAPGQGSTHGTPARWRRRVLVKAGVAGVLLIAAIAAAWSALRPEGDVERPIAASVARGAVTLLSDADRAIVGQSLAALRELQGLARPDVPPRVYLNRVSFAKTDIERAVARLTDPGLQASFNEALAVHGLAATAWRAKSVNERGQWERTGEDPAVSLCPEVGRILSVGDEPKAMSRAEWRGLVLAATVPLLWDCAADRLAAIEKDVRDR